MRRCIYMNEVERVVSFDQSAIGFCLEKMVIYLSFLSVCQTKGLLILF